MNLLNQTIEQLENDFWPPPSFQSHLVLKCHALRKKRLSDFSIEDLRIMIGQEIGLNYLVPLALNELEKNILAEGDFYPGDLFEKVRDVRGCFWNNFSEYKMRLNILINTERCISIK